MPRYSRRGSSRRSRRGSVSVLVGLLLLALLLLLLVQTGYIPGLPRVSLPPLPNVTIPITGFPTIQVPTVVIQVTAQPGLPITGPVIIGTGKQTKTSGCVSQGGLPDSACTPGAAISGVTTAQICKSGYSSSVRNVPQSVKDQVYAEYGVSSHAPGQYEVDHLISLELGGSNDIANLWPEPASPPPGFHEKDKVENYLHDQVCSGKMSLQDAQNQIATNWLDVYNRMPK